MYNTRILVFLFQVWKNCINKGIKYSFFFSDTEKFCATTAKVEISSEMDKNIDLESPQNRKHKLSPDREYVSKVAKHDIDEDAVSAVSFLNVHLCYECYEC